jgi:hypothetical protein
MKLSSTLNLHSQNIKLISGSTTVHAGVFRLSNPYSSADA